MAYKVKILADSISAETGARLTTFEITFPRFVLSELNTHRMLSKNAASSRAIPTKKMIADVEADPVFPVYFGKNKPGMEATEEMTEQEIGLFKKIWLEARDNAIKSVKMLVGITAINSDAQESNYFDQWLFYRTTPIKFFPSLDLSGPYGTNGMIERVESILEAIYESGIEIPELPKESDYREKVEWFHSAIWGQSSENYYRELYDKIEELKEEGILHYGKPEPIELSTHKQIANRILEPWMWVTVIVSGTEWDNFFALRRATDAQPEIKKIADMMFEARDNSCPEILQIGEWHIPLEQPEDGNDENIKDVFDLIKVCVGRLCRVSYLTHDGRRDSEADLKLHDRIVNAGHFSPTEHIARVTGKNEFIGNFRDFQQYRKLIPNEGRKDLFDKDYNVTNS